MVGIIKTVEQYEEALAMVEELMDIDPGPGTEDGDRLELLSLLISSYEKEHFPLEMPDAIEAIKFRLEQQQLSPKDLIPYLGSRSRVSEVLNRKRPLTLKMVRNLHKGLGIPADVLIQAPAEMAGSQSAKRNRNFSGAQKVASSSTQYEIKS
jgi:HTH-type transcriptional regulator / antitoxin HigA